MIHWKDWVLVSYGNLILRNDKDESETCENVYIYPYKDMEMEKRRGEKNWKIEKRVRVVGCGGKKGTLRTQEAREETCPYAIILQRTGQMNWAVVMTTAFHLSCKNTAVIYIP
jgi:hypothetical protein